MAARPSGVAGWLLLGIAVAPSAPAGQQDSTVASVRLLPVVQDRRWGYIDTTGTIVITPQFAAAGAFREGLAPVRISDTASGKWGFINASGRVVIQPQFEAAGPFSEGLAAVRVEGKWGYIDATGTMTIPPRMDEASGFTGGRARVGIGSSPGRKYGYIDRAGKLIGSMQFDFFSADFSDGRALVQAGNRYGYIDREGTILGRLEFTEAHSFSQGLAAVTTGGKWGFIDTSGTMVIPPRFDRAWPFSEGLARVRRGRKYGYIDRRGTVVIPLQYDSAERFSEGLAAVLKIGKGVGYINRTGTIVVPYAELGCTCAFSEGLANMRVRGKFGYIDTTGRTVIEPQFFEAVDFVGGVAAVEGHYGYIDRTGRYIWKATPERAVPDTGASVGASPRPPPPPTRAFLSDKRVTSKKQLFTVAVPRASNFAGVPFAIEHVARRDSLNFDLVAFYVKDFGEVYLVSVRLIPRRVLDQMAVERDSQTLSNLSWKALYDWRGGLSGDAHVRLEQEPDVVSETVQDTHLGRGMLRIYLARAGSLLVNEAGGAHRFDTLIGVLVVKRHDRYVYVIAENDSRALGQSDLIEGLKALFGSIQLQQ